MQLPHKVGALVASAAVLGGSIITGSIVTAGVASAAPVSSTFTCNDQTLTNTITQNLKVPAGSYCILFGNQVTGNVSAAGYLATFGATLDKNLSINGGGFVDEGYTGSTVKGNVSITGSPGAPVLYHENFIGAGTTMTVDGNFSYGGNTSYLDISPAGFGAVGPPGLDVHGNFSYGNNVYWATADGGALAGLPIPFVSTYLHVGGNSSIS